MVVDSLGDLIATLGSIDHDEIDWPNIRQAAAIGADVHGSAPAAHRS